MGGAAGRVPVHSAARRWDWLAEALGARVPLLVGGLVCLAACALCRRGLTVERPAPSRPAPERRPPGRPAELAAA
jgi:hypothetical protein